GTVDYAIVEMIKNAGLSENYLALGNISRPDAIKLTEKAQLLLLALNIADNAKGRIPGKLFENIRSKRPILCLGPTDSDVAGIISETNSGKTFEYDDYKGLRDFILDIFNNYKSGKSNFTSEGFENYDVKIQTKLLATYLNEIADKNHKTT
ncbi:MAG: hypothetical protein PHW83_10050, partial [Bacteroidales bacterium]|nr:hypothetical protein [Bacteroidales bacterium]